MKKCKRMPLVVLKAIMPCEFKEGLRTTMALSCRFPSQIASVTLRCLFIPRLVLPSSYFEVDGSEIECSRVRLCNKRSVFLATFSWLRFVALCSVFRSTASLTIFPSREIFERKAHAEAIRRDFLLFVRPAVTAAILAVVDKLSLTGQWCATIPFSTKPSPERYVSAGHTQAFYCGRGRTVASFVYLNISNFWRGKNWQKFCKGQILAVVALDQYV